MSVQEDLTVTPSPEIPDKLYFRIGEVAHLAGIKPYVLRFWETEFSSLGPKKSGTGQRLYRRKDVELVLEIKDLLYQRRFTIEGARKHLETRTKPSPNGAAGKSSTKGSRRKKAQASLFAPDPGPVLESARDELRAILKMLK
jgi:DNA-binding transcriptional MerR regulator